MAILEHFNIQCSSRVPILAYEQTMGRLFRIGTSVIFKEICDGRVDSLESRSSLLGKWFQAYWLLFVDCSLEKSLGNLVCSVSLRDRVCEDYKDCLRAWDQHEAVVVTGASSAVIEDLLWF